MQGSAFLYVERIKTTSTNDVFLLEFAYMGRLFLKKPQAILRR